MPRKRKGSALLIKPGSSVSSSSIFDNRHDESTSPSVNDLIRDSRRLQLTNVTTSFSGVSATLPPQVRQVLNLPTPETRAPRPGAGTGLARWQRIPGPAAPRSWLTDSRHAPRKVTVRTVESVRLLKRGNSLPGVIFPPPTSLQHLILKTVATNWDWHAEYDREYLTCIPVNLRELLLSYLAVHGDKVQTNPFQLLFVTDTNPDSRAEISRLDLSEAIGVWTTVKQLEKDLGAVFAAVSDSTKHEVPEIWDDNSASMSEAAPLGQIPSGSIFRNLRHLSLAIHPHRTSSASWKALIRLAEKIPTITSLSLANWPTPTYTPRAASTRALLQSSSPRPPTVYGGTNIYTAFDNDWREAAGILHSLSRTLYCLKWLDLTGCGSWLPALSWGPPGHENSERFGPEWNGSWREIEYLCFAVGWDAIEPEVLEGEDDHLKERKHTLYKQECEQHTAMGTNAQEVARLLRTRRKEKGGNWISFEF